jgi:hypothetical protein
MLLCALKIVLQAFNKPSITTLTMEMKNGQISKAALAFNSPPAISNQHLVLKPGYFMGFAWRIPWSRI